MLERFKQLAVQVEANEGTHEGSEASADLLTVTELQWTPDFERYEPNTYQLSLSPTPDRRSRASGQLKFKVELAGPADGSLATTPPFAKLLRACGLRMYGEQATAATPYGGTGTKGQVFYVVADASWTTGTLLEHGTLVTDGATGTGMVLGSYHENNTDTQRIWVLNTGTSAWASGGVITATGIAIPYTGAPVTGGRAFVPADKPSYYLKGTLTGTIAAGEIVTGATSGAKGLVVQAFNSGAELLVERAPGFGFFATGESVTASGGGDIATIQAPVQYDVPTLSLTYYEDGNRVRIAGARGSAEVMWENGKPGMLDVTLVGLHDTETSTAMLATATNEATPPVFFGANFTVDETFHPLISAYTVNLGRETAKRSDVEKANGYGFTSSFARAMTGDLDAEAVQEGVFGFIAKARTATGIAIRAYYGTGGTGNAFDMVAPKAQFNINPGARDGQSVYAQALKFFPAAGARGDEFCLFTY